MQIGFIGVGRMGAPMAANLLAAGHELWFYDPHSVSEALQERGARRADRLRQLAELPVTISMLPDVATSLAAVEEIVDEAAEGHMHIVMGTVGRDAVRTADGLARPRGIRLIDAPVSGSIDAAASGTLSVLIGCGREDLAQVQQVLSGIGSLRRVGEVGAGAVMKLVVNTLVAANNEAIGEALQLIAAAGLDSALAYDAMLASAGATPYMRYKHEAFLKPEAAPMGSPISIIQKDMHLALELAESVGASLPLSEAVTRMIDDAASIDAAVDMSRMVSIRSRDSSRADARGS